MHIPIHLIEDELAKQGRSAEAQKVLAELPAKIDHNEHAVELEKLGLDPGQLAARAAAKGLESL
jgi:acid stress-induced BolA-like protein IbaG/YrbA